MSIKRLMDLGCYRGLRHRKSLPVRGHRRTTHPLRGKARGAYVKKKASLKNSPGPISAGEPSFGIDR